jgi:hypothetical protein
MLTQTITYPDFNGNERTDTFYFNISRAELAELELINEQQGGFDAYIQRIIADRDGRQLVNTFKEIIAMSYGEKAPDGRGFLKSAEISQRFMGTEAYTQLFMQLVTDATFAAGFINGIMPQGVSKSSGVSPGPVQPQDYKRPEPAPSAREQFEQRRAVGTEGLQQDFSPTKDPFEGVPRVSAPTETDEERAAFEAWKAEREAAKQESLQNLGRPETQPQEDFRQPIDGGTEPIIGRPPHQRSE